MQVIISPQLERCSRVFSQQGPQIRRRLLQQDVSPFDMGARHSLLRDFVKTAQPQMLNASGRCQRSFSQKLESQAQMQEAVSCAYQLLIWNITLRGTTEKDHEFLDMKHAAKVAENPDLPTRRAPKHPACSDVCASRLCRCT